MKRLTIALAERSYDIVIGRNLLRQAAPLFGEAVTPSQVVVVTHPSIRKLHGEALMEGLAGGGIPTHIIEVPEGEASKSLSQAGLLYDRLLEMRCDRRTLLLAFGGGVIGDLTGFIAATYQRGVPFVQVPTTLLSQVDSSVGGKTGINHPRGKNMIGAFYQPKQVIIDLETLATLPPREFRAGLAEIVKHGVIADAGLFAYLEGNAEKILNQDSECLEHIIAASCAIKANVVEQDERESRIRMVLNFGHTLGHAIEALTGYAEWIHGEAVAMGMVAAARLSQAAGRCGGEVASRIEALLRRFGLPVEFPGLGVNAVIEALYLDKKTSHKKLTLVLVSAIGSVDIVDDVDENIIRKLLEETAREKTS